MLSKFLPASQILEEELDEEENAAFCQECSPPQKKTKVEGGSSEECNFDVVMNTGLSDKQIQFNERAYGYQKTTQRNIKNELLNSCAQNKMYEEKTCWICWITSRKVLVIDASL